MSISSLLLLGLSCSEEEVLPEDVAIISAKSSKSIELSYQNLTASDEQSSNPIEHIDDDGNDYLSTRWSAQGSSNVDVDFGEVVLVDYLNIAFFKGDERSASFTYFQSDNGEDWESVGSKVSSGDTEEHEEFDLTNMTTRYLRLEFNGNSSNEWNSVLDLEILGTPSGEEEQENSNPTSSGTTIPVKIEAEDFSAQSGTQTENTSDANGGQNVGYIDAGDYLEYAINVESAGEYTIDFRVASRTNDIKFDIYQGDSKKGSVSTGTTGGWQSWKTISTTVDLNSGNQTIRIFATGTGWNINWLEFKEANGEENNNEEVEEENNSGNLDPNKTPAENFDLSKWKITMSDGNDVSVEDLNDNFEFDNQFYTGNDGAMVFKNFPAGAGTTTNSTFSRVEFREMLRGTNTSISTQGVNGNNWVFSSSSSSVENAAGAVDGVMTATLKVDRVTTTSDSDSQIGRIVIGQIHASDNEPIRLYYHKQPDHDKGAIYFAHETADGDERFYNMIGNYANDCDCGSAGDYEGAGEPSNGIALGEVFGYRIEVEGNTLYVVIYNENGSTIASEALDMSNSDFENDWMYFKAGLYSQNKSVQNSSDFEQVSFYSLNVTH